MHRRASSFRIGILRTCWQASLKEQEHLPYARIEGIEDLDVLVRQSGRFLERYYQMKSIEDSSPWSFKSLWSDGVFRRFFFEYMAFVMHPDRANRDIEFVFVTDGKLAIRRCQKRSFMNIIEGETGGSR